MTPAKSRHINARVRKMWKHNRPQIIADLLEITKAAVIGRAYRMGLPKKGPGRKVTLRPRPVAVWSRSA